MGAAAPERERDIAVESKRRRAITDRPYIHAGGAVEGNDNPSVKIGCEEPILTAPFTQGSLGRCRASATVRWGDAWRRESGRSMIAPTHTPGVRWKKKTTPQSASLTAPLTRGALGAAAPEGGIGRGGRQNGGGRSMIAPTYTTGVRRGTSRVPQQGEGEVFGTGDPSPTKKPGGAVEGNDNPSVKIGCEEPILTAPFTQGSLGRCRARAGTGHCG